MRRIGAGWGAAIILVLVACSGASKGTGTSSGGDPTKSIKSYFDQLASGYCQWLADCGRLEGPVSSCVAELAGDNETRLYTECRAAGEYYEAHRAEMDGCLGAKPACGGDDLKRYCPAFGSPDFDALEKQCKGASSSDAGSDTGTSDCTQTTFKITNWAGAPASNSLYTGTSFNLQGCTQLQPDLLTVAFKCPSTSAGNSDLISEGCAVLGAAAPGNVLTDKGANPTTGTKCAGRTVKNQTITCNQKCRRDLTFQITNGPCN